MKKKKKKNRAKAKGSAFERLVCKELSLWVSNGIRDDLYWRSAMSGGRASVRFKKTNKTSSTQAGDITAIDPLGKPLLDVFCIECKTYKALHYQSLLFLKPKDSSFVGFWTQARDAANDHNLTPMLIAKQNKNAEPVVCLNTKGLNKLNGSTYAETYLYSSVLDLYVFIMTDFFKAFKLKRRRRV